MIRTRAITLLLILPLSNCMFPTLLLSSTSLLRLTPSTDCDLQYQIYNKTTQTCTCKIGFSGIGCRMCASTAACQNNLHSESLECVRGLIYRNSYSEIKTYSCRLAPSIQSLLSHAALSVQCNRSTKNCSVAIYKEQDTLLGPHVIDCALSNCLFADGSADGQCEDIQCHCGEACSPIARKIVDHFFNHKPVQLFVKDQHNLTLAIKDSPIPLEAICDASACELKDSGGSGGGDTPSCRVFCRYEWILAALSALSCLICCKCWSQRTAALNRKKYGKILKPREAIESFQFSDISCRVDTLGLNERHSSEATMRAILSSVSGKVEGNQVLGILGPSGSGKTSLLNILAGVENGDSQLTGSLRLDGKEIPKQYRKLAAYVQQDDVLFPKLTVRECIWYSAQLRLPRNVDNEAKDQLVDSIIQELKLDHVAEAYIGSIGKKRGISGGERRRVSIGMEMVTSPKLLFLDEPTSGLDSASANSVIQIVKDLASHGRIAILSIHQPSRKSFLALDQIIVLARGKTMYQGRPSDAKAYFEAIGFPCPEYENMADHILEIASHNATRERAIAHADRMQETDDILERDDHLCTLDSFQEEPSCRYLEFRVLLWRNGINLMRHRSLLQLHLLLSLTLGLCGGLIFHHVTDDLAGFQNRSGAFYFILTFFAFASMSSIDIFIRERPIFLKETGALYYGAFPYFITKALLDIVFLRVLPAAIFSCVFYWIMGLQPTLYSFLWFLTTIVLFNVASGAISVCIGIVSSTSGTANLIATVVFLIMLLFGGFLLNTQTMPIGVSWVKRFSIFSYGFEILMTTELHGLLLNFNAPGYPTIPVYGDVFLRTLGMDYDNRLYDLAAIALIGIGLQALSYLFLVLQVPNRAPLNLPFVGRSLNENGDSRQGQKI